MHAFLTGILRLDYWDSHIFATASGMSIRFFSTPLQRLEARHQSYTPVWQVQTADTREMAWG